jgi:hypothetical protein
MKQAQDRGLENKVYDTHRKSEAICIGCRERRVAGDLDDGQGRVIWLIGNTAPKEREWEICGLKEYDGTSHSKRRLESTEGIFCCGVCRVQARVVVVLVA